MLWQYVYYISDSALGFLLKIIMIFLKIFSVTSDELSRVCNICPQHLYMMSEMLKNDAEDFKEFVVCTKYCSLHDYNDCCHVVEGLAVTKHCSYI